jgi:Lrp/AsnC family transcriptional regulator for asnA, asnC and gidA
MDNTNLDTLDNDLIRLLTENGRMPIGEMTKRLKVTAPTIRSRIKSLEEKGLLKVSGIIDPNQHSRLIEVLEKIARLPNVVWAGVITGRYDIIAEVAFVGGKAELYKFTTNTILKMGNVVRSETFIIMSSRQNWLCLPKGVKEI